MKYEFNRYGVKISAEEYDVRVVSLQDNLPPMPSKAQETTVCQGELNAQIDYKLGVDFPQEKRTAMWGVAQQIEKERWRLPFLSLNETLAALFGKAGQGNNIPGYLAKRYGQVLDQQDLRAFLGDTPAP